MTNTATSKEEFDTVSFITAYENGSLDDDEIISGFQHLIDSGVAWQLQGMYGRQAQALIDSGACIRPAPKKEVPPALGEVRSSASGQGRLPHVGPFEYVSRDTVRSVGQERYRLVVYGAYNAAGLIGSESNGIAVLREDPPSVIADEMGCESSGYYGPSVEQLDMFERLRTCSDEVFRALVNDAVRLRLKI